jgi:hypothetical protein
MQWAWLTHKRWWWCVFLVAANLGTVVFMVAAPRLVAEWWRTSRFTRLLTLLGRSGNAQATLSLHRHGHYRLKKEWTRAPGEIGVVMLGEPGTYTDTAAAILLRSWNGNTRCLQRSCDGYVVAEETLPGPASADHAVAGWKFEEAPQTRRS